MADQEAVGGPLPVAACSGSPVRVACGATFTHGDGSVACHDQALFLLVRCSSWLSMSCLAGMADQQAFDGPLPFKVCQQSREGGSFAAGHFDKLSFATVLPQAEGCQSLTATADLQAVSDPTPVTGLHWKWSQA